MYIRKLVESCLLIEGLSLITDEMMIEQDPKTTIKNIGSIYRIAHIATDHCEECKDGNVAEQDKQMIERIKKELRDSNTIDVDKELEKLLS